MTRRSAGVAARICGESFRGEDAIARIGGEEFVVAMLGMGREDAVTRLAVVLRAFADTTLEVDGQRLRVGASAGVAEQGRDGTGFEELYRAADDALRVAKVSGRGRVVPAGAAPPVGPGPVLARGPVVEDGPVEPSPA